LDGKIKMKKNKLDIHCSYTDLINPNKLKPNPKNINKHPNEQVQIIARILNAHGWRLPITVSKRSGFIVRGEGRLKAALELELTEVPIDYQDYVSNEEELADLAADTKAAEGSYLDEDLEKSLLEELNTKDFDLSLAGYSYNRVKELLGLNEVEDTDKDDDEEDEKTKTKEKKWIEEYESGSKYLVIVGNDFRTLVERKLFDEFKIAMENISNRYDIEDEEVFALVIKQSIILLNRKKA